MGLFNLFRGQFIDVIEYPNENPAVLVHRFERFNNEIKYGAKLIVRPGQAAVFVRAKSPTNSAPAPTRWRRRTCRS